MRVVKYSLILAALCLSASCSAGTPDNIIPNCNLDASVNANECLQFAFDRGSETNTPVKLSNRDYVINKPLVIKSNLTLLGESATIIPNLDPTPWIGALSSTSAHDVSITNLNIRGDGYFNNGFSRRTAGIYIAGMGSNISITKTNISGLHMGIWLTGTVASHGVTLSDNYIHEMGQNALYLFQIHDAVIKNNLILNIFGNYTGIPGTLAASKFADGIYMQGAVNTLIANNRISNVKRIGIVLEGSNADGQLIASDNVTIADNLITNMNDSRGSELNAGIWVEPYCNEPGTFFYKTKLVTIIDNTIDNTGAVRGSHDQYGIRLGAETNIVKGNIISNFSNAPAYGIVYSFGLNHLENNLALGNARDLMKGGDNRHFSQLEIKNDSSADIGKFHFITE